MDAIRWEGNTLYLLDQTKLPVTEVWLPYTDYRPVADAIRTMVVRGAPAIGVAAAYAYCLAALAGEGLDEAKETLPPAGPQRSTCSGPWSAWNARQRSAAARQNR